jgi:large subunit ribosomal protein L10
MGKNLAEKQEIVSDLRSALTTAQMVMVIDYAGLSVAEITKLRKQMRPVGTFCKTTKNTLMKKAIADQAKWLAIGDLLKGTSACLFVESDIAATLKAYQAFQKETKKTELRGGVFDGRTFAPDQIKAVADLPPKEVLLAKIAGLVNAVPSRLAGSVNAVPQSLGRAINEVPASLARAVKAMQEQKAGAN